MTEREEAIALANRVLDRVNADPDDDLAVLARQLLRTADREADSTHSVLAEIEQKRQRQINVHGYTAEHDDEHPGDMAEAAACYAMAALFTVRFKTPDKFYKDGRHGTNLEYLIPLPDGEGAPQWPWEEAAWRPTDPRDDLIKAATLIVAEIERIDRALKFDTSKDAS